MLYSLNKSLGILIVTHCVGLIHSINFLVYDCIFSEVHPQTFDSVFKRLELAVRPLWANMPLQVTLLFYLFFFNLFHVSL